MIFAMVFFVVTRPVPSELPDPNIETLQMNVAAAQLQFHQAIAEMETAAVAKLDVMPAQMAVVYAHNLHELNRAIAQCEQLLQKDNDPMVYGHLGRAYAAKVDLLESLLDI